MEFISSYFCPETVISRHWRRMKMWKWEFMNPVTPLNLFKLNYRMHDKYLIIDEKIYLLGGRNSNDIFLGDQTEDINVDRDILVYDTSEGKGESLLQLEDYFSQNLE